MFYCSNIVHNTKLIQFNDLLIEDNTFIFYRKTFKRHNNFFVFKNIDVRLINSVPT